MSEPKPKLRCDMHRKDVEPQENFVISYKAQSLKSGADYKEDDYKEEFQFCSWGCFIAWLIDDEKVLKLYAKRMTLPREVRHPHGASRTLRLDRHNNKAYLEPWDDADKPIFATETIEMLNLYENEDDYKQLDKEERQILAELSAE